MEKHNRLRSNIAANMMGRLVSTVLAVVFTPVYIHFLGIEAYGLIGFYIALQAALSFLELGLSYTCNRELAKRSDQGESAVQIMLDILRSLEVVYWGIALLIGLLLSLLASAVSSGWLDSKIFSSAELKDIVIIMAWVIAVRWPAGLYQGALNGLQKQVPLNVVLVLVAVLNWGGSALALWMFEPTIQVFFLWQLGVAMSAVTLYMVMAWLYMPGNVFQGRFSFNLLVGLLPFTMGVAANAILGTVLLQADKLIVSAIVPLKTFAYYVLASMIAEAIIMLAIPVSNAVFPRMAQMVGGGAEKNELASFFHLSAQAVNILALPIGLMLAVFSYDVLLTYTGSQEIAKNTALVLSIMAIAKTLHANMLIPYVLLMSIGKLKLSVQLNVISVCMFLPLVVILAQNYGLVGAASVWLIIMLCYVFVGMPMILRQCFEQQWRRWVIVNIIRPFLLITPMLLVIKEVISKYDLGRWETGGVLVFIGIFMILVIVLLLPEVRGQLRKSLFKKGVK